MKTIVIADGGYIMSGLRSRFHLGLENGRFAIELHKWFSERLVPKAAKACKQRLDLFRIHYYDCYSYRDSIYNPFTGKMSETVEPRGRDIFLDTMGRLPQVYLRLGKLIINGWKPVKPLLPADLGGKIEAALMAPNYQQKQVDIMIAMDTCQIMNLRQAEVLIYLTDDSDFAPVLEEARRQGMIVMLCNLKAKKKTTGALSVASDYILRVDNADVPFLRPLSFKQVEDEFSAVRENEPTLQPILPL